MKKIIVISVFLMLCLLVFLIDDKEEQKFSGDNLDENQLGPQNFKKVNKDYYRSGKLEKEDYSYLNKVGIRTIIDFRLNIFGYALRKKHAANKAGINYFNIPLIPIFPPTESQISKFFSILDNADNLPVLIHCLHGMDRSGLMTALYRVRNYHWTFDQAYAEMLKTGYHKYRYPLLKDFLLKRARENSKTYNF